MTDTPKIEEEILEMIHGQGEINRNVADAIIIDNINERDLSIHEKNALAQLAKWTNRPIIINEGDYKPSKRTRE